MHLVSSNQIAQALRPVPQQQQQKIGEAHGAVADEFGCAGAAPLSLDCGSVASPNRETEGMLDGSDAISDWALLNFAVNAVSGASWVSFHHGGGVGIGYSQHAGQVIVCDGTEEADARLARVLTNDPMMGIFRHVDAGYEEARQCAREHAVQIPMRAGDSADAGKPAG